MKDSISKNLHPATKRGLGLKFYKLTSSSTLYLWTCRTFQQNLKMPKTNHNLFIYVHKLCMIWQVMLLTFIVVHLLAVVSVLRIYRTDASCKFWPCLGSFCFSTKLQKPKTPPNRTCYSKKQMLKKLILH